MAVRASYDQAVSDATLSAIHETSSALAELPGRARQVAELRSVQGREIEEIAVELVMKRNAATSRKEGET